MYATFEKQIHVIVTADFSSNLSAEKVVQTLSHRHSFIFNEHVFSFCQPTHVVYMRAVFLAGSNFTYIDQFCFPTKLGLPHPCHMRGGHVLSNEALFLYTSSLSQCTIPLPLLSGWHALHVMCIFYRLTGWCAKLVRRTSPKRRDNSRKCDRSSRSGNGCAVLAIGFLSSRDCTLHPTPRQRFA